MRAIETNNLTKKYKDVTAVDDLCLSVEQGELFALLGVNGAGKTTTIKMLSCLTGKTEDMIKRCSLGEKAGKKAGTLSGGWQRRLSIAMALISEPDILFLDEPTLGLDVLARRELWEMIEGLKGKVTVVLTTHYLEEAESLSDRIGIMAGGRLSAVGTAEELMKKAGKEKFEEAFVVLCRGGSLS